MSITLDYETSTELPWTLVAEDNNKIIAAVCDKILEKAEFKLNLLLIELGYSIYDTVTDEDGFVIY